MANEWTPTSRRQRPAAHIPAYPDEAVLQAEEQCPATYPPLVFAGETRFSPSLLDRADAGRRTSVSGGPITRSVRTAQRV